METKEFYYSGLTISGFLAIPILIIFLVSSLWCCVETMHSPAIAIGIVLTITSLICFGGLIKLEPNEAVVLVFFGNYSGTFSRTGLYWINPLLTRKRVSLRARNLDLSPIKVNDKAGNPILIGIVLVWKLEDTYKALFDIDSQSFGQTKVSQASNIFEYYMLSRASHPSKAFEYFVSVQSDAALRQVAGDYAYDNTDSEDELTLRSNADEINEQLVNRINERLLMAGIHIVEARINYLAYAPEIAAVMLRRQQADAIVSAREKIVEGAVGMVKLALDNLKDEGVVDLNEDRKAAMVSNLLVVLCGDESAQPVVNTGE